MEDPLPLLWIEMFRDTLAPVVELASRFKGIDQFEDFDGSFPDVLLPENISDQLHRLCFFQGGLLR